MGRCRPRICTSTVGHPLLSSWGKTGRDFLKLVVEASLRDEAEDFRDPGSKDLLGFLQSGILNLER